MSEGFNLSTSNGMTVENCGSKTSCCYVITSNGNNFEFGLELRIIFCVDLYCVIYWSQNCEGHLTWLMARRINLSYRVYFLISGAIFIKSRDVHEMDVTGWYPVDGHKPLQPLVHYQTPIPECTAPESSPEVTSSQNHIKRPLNSFMLWANKQRRRIALDNPQMSSQEIAKQLGAEWRLLSESDKRPFIEEAKELKRQHELDDPYFKFIPRRKRKVRRVHPGGRAPCDLHTGDPSRRANSNSASDTYPSFSDVNSAQTSSSSFSGFVSSHLPSTSADHSTPSFYSAVDAFGHQQKNFTEFLPLQENTAAPISNFYPSAVSQFPSNMM